MFRHNFVTPPIMNYVIAEDGKKYYTRADGKQYESVTTYLSRVIDKPQLVEWRARVGEVKANKITCDASQRGKNLHSVAEKYLLNESVDLKDSPFTKSLFIRLRPLLDRISNIRLIEKSIYSDELELAGTPDICADFDGVSSILDVKSNTFARKKRIDLVNYMCQTACYDIMMQERFGIAAQQSVVLIASPFAIDGMAKIEPMDMCIRMLKHLRRDPVGFNSILAGSGVAGQGSAFHKPSDSLRIS